MSNLKGMAVYILRDLNQKKKVNGINQLKE
jgi:hypothetical protein